MSAPETSSETTEPSGQAPEPTVAGADVEARGSACEQNKDERVSADAAAAPVPRAFQRYESYFAPFLGLVFAVTFLKGFRMPNAWTATHFAFNYSQGFIRRGLVGEIARRLFGENVFRYNYFAAFAFTTMVLVAIGLLLLIRRMLRVDPHDPGLKSAMLCFASSPGLVFFVHAIGYLDYIGLLLLLAFMLWAARARSPHIFAAVLPIGIVYAGIHECLAVMFAPTMLFTMICHVLDRARREGLSIRSQLALVGAAIAATAFVFGLSMLVSTYGTKPPEQLHALFEALRPRVDFLLRNDAFEALYRSAKDNFYTLMPGHWANPAVRYEAKRELGSVLPGLAFLLYYGLHLIRQMQSPLHERWLLALVFVGASLSPLPLHFFGWDYSRWDAVTVIDCFCCIGILKVFLPPLTPGGQAAEHSALPPLSVVLGLSATVLGLSADYGLFDGYAVQYFPFDRQVLFIIHLFKSGFAYRPPN